MEKICIDKSNDFLYYEVFNIKGRTIYSPSLSLWWRQRNILKSFKKHYPLSMSILQCAEKHANQKWLLKMDIEHFYESIPIEMITDILKEFSGKTALYGIRELKRVTIVNGVLPTGAATSPHLANACMVDNDKKIEQKCKERGVKYSRYMDDLFFSANAKTDLQKIEKYVRELLGNCNLHINEDKVKYVSQNKKQVIMGLLVNKEKACLPKETKRKIRAILHQYMAGKTNDENYVAGYLSYVFDVDKEYFRILNRYFGTYKKKYPIDASNIRIIGKLFNHNMRKI